MISIIYLTLTVIRTRFSPALTFSVQRDNGASLPIATTTSNATLPPPNNLLLTNAHAQINRKTYSSHNVYNASNHIKYIKSHILSVLRLCSRRIYTYIAQCM